MGKGRERSGAPMKKKLATKKMMASVGEASMKKPIKVVYISNPMRFTASASEFQALVQKLTGRHSDLPLFEEIELSGPVVEELELSGPVKDETTSSEYSLNSDLNYATPVSGSASIHCRPSPDPDLHRQPGITHQHHPHSSSMLILEEGLINPLRDLEGFNYEFKSSSILDEFYFTSFEDRFSISM